MTDARAAVGMDRLPWLTDEPRPRERANTGARELLAWALAGIFFLAGISYWMGVRSIRQPEELAAGPRAARETTVPLPEARPAQPQQPTVVPAPLPEVEPVVAPPIPIVEEPARERVAKPAPVKHAKASPPKPKAKARTEASKPASKPAVPKAGEPVYWPARVVEGASGRLVRIGTFQTSRQAKKGWWAIMRMNPALKRLPAVVVPVQSLRNGQVYYRLQMGTSSQAHSAVLCQRMRMIGQSCVVIGLNRAGGEIAT